MKLEYRIGYTFEDRFTSRYRAFQNAFKRGLNEIQEGFRSIDRQFEASLTRIKQKAEGEGIKIKTEVERLNLSDFTFPDLVQRIKQEVEPFEPVNPPDLIQKVRYETAPVRVASLPDLVQRIDGEFEVSGIATVYRQILRIGTGSQKALERSFAGAFEGGVKKWKGEYRDFQRYLDRKPLEVPTKLEIDDKELERVRDRSLSITVFPVFGGAKEVAEEQAATLSEALYEGVRYGLKKAELAKAFFEEIKRSGGYIGTEELAQAFVELTEIGVRGVEKEMAEFAGMVVEVSKATRLSYEDVARLTYEMQGLGMAVKGMKEVFAYTGGALEKYNLTQSKVIENLERFKQTAGSVFAGWDEQVKKKVLKGIVDISGKLESLYLDSTAFTEQIGKLLSGQIEGASGLVSLLGRAGYSYRDFVRAMKSGDVQSAQEMLMKGLLSIREQLLAVPEEVRGQWVKQFSDMYGISEETLNQLVNKGAQEIRKVFAESVSPVDMEERVRETTNVITRWSNVVKNKLAGMFGAELTDIVGDFIGNIPEAATTFVGFQLLRRLGIGIPKLPKIGIPKPFFFDKESREVGKLASVVGEASQKIGLVSRAGEILSKLGRFGAGFSLVGAGLEFVRAKTLKEKAEAVGGGMGGFSGALAGAALGSAILPGIGTILGGIIGGLGGDWIGRKISGLFFKQEPKKITSVEREKIKEHVREKETVKEVSVRQEELSVLLAIAQKLDVLGDIKAAIEEYLIQQRMKPSPSPVYTGMEDWLDKGFKR